MNASPKEFTDISSEAFREYHFKDGIVKITNPLMLNVSSMGHRLFDAQGNSHYIPLGWMQLTFRVRPGQPNFVK